MSKSEDYKNVTPTDRYNRDQEASKKNGASSKPPRDLEPASLRVVMESYDPSLNEKIRKVR